MGAVLTFLSTLFVFSVVNGTPLLYGTLGEILTEKSGNMNLGVEGILFMGGAAGLALGLGAEVLLLKGLRGLGGLHVLPLPDGHAPAIEMPVAVLGQERVHQGLRPAPAPQLAGGQLLFRPAFSHGGCPPVV